MLYSSNRDYPVPYPACTSSTTVTATDIIPSHIMLTSSNLEPVDEGEFNFHCVALKIVCRCGTDVRFENHFGVEIDVRLDRKRKMTPLATLMNFERLIVECRQDALHCCTFT